MGPQDDVGRGEPQGRKGCSEPQAKVPLVLRGTNVVEYELHHGAVHSGLWGISGHGKAHLPHDDVGGLLLRR